MSDYYKISAVFLRTFLKDSFGINLGSSHAHMLIAAALGYGSKKALSEDLDWLVESEFLMWEAGLDDDLRTLGKAVSSVRCETGLSDLPLYKLHDAIRLALTPDCECCGEKRLGGYPVFTMHPNDNSFPDGWVCETCFRLSRRAYGKCSFCDDPIVYRSDALNRNGECDVHAGEGYMSEEERADWESYIEFLNK